MLSRPILLQEQHLLKAASFCAVGAGISIVSPDHGCALGVLGPHLLHPLRPPAEPLELGTQTNSFLLQLLLIIQTL